MKPAAQSQNPALPLTAAQTALVAAQASLGTSNLYWTAQCLKLERTELPQLGMQLTGLLEACEALHYQPELAAAGWSQRLSNAPINLQWIYLTEAAEPADTAQQLCRALLAQPFTLGEQLYHCRVFLLPSSTWVYLQVHHLAFDGYSYSLFWQALCARLHNPQLPLPDWRLAPLIEQEGALRQSSAHQSQVDQLRRRLPAPLPWQVYNPLADISAPRLIEAPRLALTQVQAAAAQLNLSWPQWLACACGWVLHQLGWTHDKALGLVNMGRRGPQARVPLMCMGLQALHSPAATTLSDWIPRFQQELSAWQQSPQVRWEELAAVGFSQPLGACLNLLLFPQTPQLPGCSLQVSTLAQGPVQQLNLNLSVDNLSSDGPTLCLQAAIPDTWNDLGAEHVLQALSKLLVNPAATLQQTPPNLLLGPVAPAPIDLLGRLWQQQARAPDAPAYCSLAGQFTSYQRLYQQVVSLSAQLRAAGVQPGERVALWAEPGLTSLLAFLAIGFCQASYLPLDPKSCPELLRAQLAAAGVQRILVSQNALPWLADTLPALEHVNLNTLLASPAAICTAPPRFAPEREAYVLFTSGSSGVPKGVSMSWGAYGQFLAAAQQAYQPPLAARWLQFAALSFDASLEEIGLCLSHGGCLFERPEPCDFASLNALISRWQLNVLDLPTAYWHQWIDSAPPPQASLQLTIIGGEALCPLRLAAFRQLQGLGRLINSYGPTETCIVACAQPLGAQAPASLGQPLAGMGALILGPQQQPLPAGSSGQLYLFGAQLAEGYLCPLQTRQRFVAPAPTWQLPTRLYSTGDMARLNENGELEFLGRNDDEIKLDGQRIDLLALTQAHLAHPAIAQAALWLERSTRPPRVLAALVLTPGYSFNPQALKHHLAQTWPAAALPSRYLTLSQLPLNSRGKTDWAALARLAAAEQPSPTSSDLTQRLEQLWQDCLGSRPEPEDDFWQAGGRSLSALVLAQQISALLGQSFAAQQLYATPRFSALCQCVEQLATTTCASPTAANLCLYTGTHPARVGLTLYACAPIDGGVEVYRPLAEACGLPLWGLPSNNAINTEQPFDDWVNSQCQWLLGRPGRLLLLGWSSGGSLALALATALQQAGRPPQAVLLLDAYPPPCWQAHPAPTRRAALLNLIDVPEGFDPHALSEEALAQWLTRQEGSYADLSATSLEALVQTTLAQMQHFRQWRFAPYSGPVDYLAAALTPGPVPHQEALTGAACGPIRWHSLQASHLSLLEAPHLPAIASLLHSLVTEAQHVPSP